MKKLNLKFVSELIGDDYKKWKKGELIGIESQTGTGKNYFIFNTLLKNLKLRDKMIYFCNRSALKNETKLELYLIQNIPIPMTKEGEIDWGTINKTATIGKVTVRTYQSLSKQCMESQYSQTNDIDLSKYKYTIFDEFHYIFNDTFTGMTDLIRDRVYQKDSTIKIFISATMDNIKDDIIITNYNRNGNNRWYTQPTDYSYVKVHKLEGLGEIYPVIENSSDDERWLIFIESIAQGKAIQKAIGEEYCMFIKSGSGNIEEIVENKKFEKKICISTSVLDNGINIKDPTLKHIVILTDNKTKFIQMLGRIRFFNQKDEIYANELNLYIPIIKMSTFQKRLFFLEEKQEIIDLYKNDRNKFLSEYGRNFKELNKDLFYINENGINLNSTGAENILHDIEFYNSCLERFFETKEEFRKDMISLDIRLEWINKDCSEAHEIPLISFEANRKKLIKYFNKIKDKELFAEDQKGVWKEILKILSLSSKEFTKSHNMILKVSSLEHFIRDKYNLPFIVKRGIKSETIENTRKQNRFIIIRDF